MRADREAADIVELEVLHLAGLGIDPAHRGGAAGVAVGEPEIAVEIGLRVMHPGEAVAVDGVPATVAAVVQGTPEGTTAVLVLGSSGTSYS
jgi:hypothetical protein